jgi:hypothetical protein
VRYHSTVIIFHPGRIVQEGTSQGEMVHCSLNNFLLGENPLVLEKMPLKKVLGMESAPAHWLLLCPLRSIG